jgi:tetratricopeptide (TPR) repeat protein
MDRRLLKAGILVATGCTLFVALWLDFSRSPPAPSESTRAAASKSPAAPQVTKAGDPHEARMLAQALEKKPDHSPVLMRLAKLATEAGKPAEARKHLEQAIQADPENADARLELGKILFEAGDVSGAVEQTGRILKTHPNHPDALYNLGAIYGNLGNTKLALENWEKLISTSPDSESGTRARQMIAQLKGSSR